MRTRAVRWWCQNLFSLLNTPGTIFFPLANRYSGRLPKHLSDMTPTKESVESCEIQNSVQ